MLGSSPPSPGVYAVSIPGVLPGTCISWFQANQACRLSRKRLLSNREWQGAAAGTPDPGGMPGPNECNLNSAGFTDTGSRTTCKSTWGAFDMVGNLEEWVAEWADRAGGCTDWLSTVGFTNGDQSCFGGPGGAGGTGDFNSLPGALLRGGSWFNVTFPGVFEVKTVSNPSVTDSRIGFRCAR